MKKNKTDLINRMAFIQMCVEQPEKGSAYLMDIARQMKKLKRTPDILKQLKKVLFISEYTIYRDLEKY
jgi:ABC-type hemin transport system substrate-binding protein